MTKVSVEALGRLRSSCANTEPYEGTGAETSFSVVSQVAWMSQGLFGMWDL